MNAPDFYEMFTLPEGVKKVAVQLDPKQPNTAIFEVQKEDHTLGNILTKRLLKDKRVLFSGYQVPHPLEHKILVRVQTTDEVSPIEAVRDSISALLVELSNIRSKFEFDLARAKAEQEAMGTTEGAGPGAEHRHIYPKDSGTDPTLDANVDVDF
ncbi:DNA-directed RNA polymerase II core subunit [Dimargaris xerosporica]|nr:DNA-directed RNA polymerase II core subunit [Dimargaris xerosporica]